MVLLWIILSSLGAAEAPPTFLFVMPPHVGGLVIEGSDLAKLRAQISPSISAEQARDLAKQPFCASSRRRSGDKFDEIRESERKGLCWCLAQIGRARPVQQRRFPDALTDLATDPSAAPVLGPPVLRHGRLKVETVEQGLSLTQLDPAADYQNGDRKIYWLVSRGDFTGDGQEDLLLWEQFDSLSGTFANCSVVVVDRVLKAKSRLRWRARIGLGRCA